MASIPASRRLFSFSKANGIEHTRLFSADRSGAAVPVALGGALVANVLDAWTTWIAIAHYGAREGGMFASTVVRASGLLPGILIVKGIAVLALLGIAITGTAGEPRWWRVPPNHRWMVAGALWVATAWFGCLAVHNAIGAWEVSRLLDWPR